MIDLAAMIEKTGSVRFILVLEDDCVVGGMFIVVGEVDCMVLSFRVASLCRKFFSLLEVQIMAPSSSR